MNYKFPTDDHKPTQRNIDLTWNAIRNVIERFNADRSIENLVDAVIDEGRKPGVNMDAVKFFGKVLHGLIEDKPDLRLVGLDDDIQKSIDETGAQLNKNQSRIP